MMNSCNFIGRLTKDPEFFDEEKKRVHFCLAVDRDNFKDGKSGVDYLDFIAWNSTAEYIKRHFNKGDLMNVVNARAKVFEHENPSGVMRRDIEFEVGKAYCVGRSHKVDDD